MIQSSFLSLSGDGLGHRLLAHPEDGQLLVGMAGEELLDALPFLASVEIGTEQALDDEMDLAARYPLEHRTADGGVPAQAAAQKDVVPLDALTRRTPLAQGRALEADVADPVVGAGVRAAVQVEPQPGDRLAERRLQMLDDPLQPSLGLGHRVVAGDRR